MKKHSLRALLYQSLLFIVLFVCVPPLWAQQSSLHFDGANDYIQTNYPGILGNNSRTVEAWVKTTATTGENLVTTWGSDAVNGGRFTIRLNSVGGNLLLRIENKGGGINGITPLNDGNWHHIAVVYDNAAATNKYKLYVDGVLDAQGNISQALNTVANTNMIIGRRITASLGGYFSGAIDEVRVWNTARSQAQIQANMNIELCGEPANLTAYFKLNEGAAEANNTGLTSVSSEVGSYTGTLNGFALTGTSSNFVDGSSSLLSADINSAVTLTEATLTAAQTGASYQWVDCDNSNSFIDGAVNQSFTPEVSGNYAVIITMGSCIQTSDCTEVTIVAEVCEVPTAVAVNTITQTEATVIWTAGDDETEWEVIYGLAGFNPENEGTTLEITAVPTADLTDLTADTAYEAYVRAVCDEDDRSDWTGAVAFTTLADVAEVCEGPSQITVSEITTTSAVVMWVENGDATQWEVIYGITGFDPETEGTTMEAETTAEITLTDLEPETSYDIYVRAVCDEELMSNWAGSETFTTDGLGISDNQIAGLVLYPNPTTDIINIKAQNVIEVIEVYTISGQRIIQNNIDSVYSEINLSELPVGIYIMQITSNSQKGIYKIIKK